MTAILTKAGVTSGRHPACNMGDILTGSGYVEYLRAIGKNAMLAHDALQEAATIKQRGIEKTGKRYRLDIKWAARRCVKPLHQAAALQWETAKMASLAIKLYQAEFADASQNKVKSGEDRPDK